MPTGKSKTPALTRAKRQASAKQRSEKRREERRAANAIPLPTIAVEVNGSVSREPLDIIIRKSYAQSTALFAKLHATQVEIQQLRTSVEALLRLVQTTLALDVEERKNTEVVDWDALEQLNHIYTKSK